jgi:Flp pilus assembly protein TadD
MKATLRPSLSIRSLVPAIVLWFGLALSVGAQAIPPSIERLVEQGIEALKADDPKAAEKAFSEVLRQGWKTALVYHNLGITAQRLGDNEKAVDRFREAIRLEPEYGPSRLLIGSSLMMLGRTSEAIPQLERAIRLLPSEAQAHSLLAAAYAAAGDWMSAANEYQSLASLAPSDAEAAYQSGRSFARLSEWCYQQIARADPNSARLHQSLGLEYVFQHKNELAIESYEKAARSDPKLPEIHLALALIYLDLKKLDDAEREIELELKLVPESKAARETKNRIETARESSSK